MSLHDNKFWEYELTVMKGNWLDSNDVKQGKLFSTHWTVYVYFWNMPTTSREKPAD